MPTDKKLDEIVLLQMVDEHASIQEMAVRLGKGVATIHAELRRLERVGYIAPPGQFKAARSRKLTPRGRELLDANRSIHRATVAIS